MRRVVLLLLVMSAEARADGPVVVHVGLGINAQLDNDDDDGFYSYSRTTKVGPTFHLDIAYRFMDQLAAGAHVGLRRFSYEEGGGNIPGAEQMYSGVATPFELGVVTHWSSGRFWLAAWAGVEVSHHGAGERQLALALGAGADIFINPSGHRLGVYLDLSHTQNEYDSDQHLSVCVAYRYW